jgi:hypothetical protein
VRPPAIAPPAAVVAMNVRRDGADEDPQGGAVGASGISVDMPILSVGGRRVAVPSGATSGYAADSVRALPSPAVGAELHSLCGTRRDPTSGRYWDDSRTYHCRWYVWQ